ncbi:hypothetical protein HPQ64_12500 [Rhizobiales bacterium]|uniref:hypothetical protein n=1 Tax=Hongsoonwoonella zoysiae TaxID=2821844 RepID=UPI0015607DB4|nr:hypothetical protein [Hongsoonwoonella zoysiae]NRG18509.1 hypothetical protein [Hongsoonwoonella zoysiae]
MKYVICSIIAGQILTTPELGLLFVLWVLAFLYLIAAVSNMRADFGRAGKLSLLEARISTEARR